MRTRQTHVSWLEGVLADVVLAAELLARKGERVDEAGDEEEGAQVGAEGEEAVDDLLPPYERASQRVVLTERAGGLVSPQEGLEPARHRRTSRPEVMRMVVARARRRGWLGAG